MRTAAPALAGIALAVPALAQDDVVAFVADVASDRPCAGGHEGSAGLALAATSAALGGGDLVYWLARAGLVAAGLAVPAAAHDVPLFGHATGEWQCSLGVEPTDPRRVVSIVPAEGGIDIVFRYAGETIFLHALRRAPDGTWQAGLGALVALEPAPVRPFGERIARVTHASPEGPNEVVVTYRRTGADDTLSIRIENRSRSEGDTLVEDYACVRAPARR